jgi:hypothetical protein
LRSYGERNLSGHGFQPQHDALATSIFKMMALQGKSVVRLPTAASPSRLRRPVLAAGVVRLPEPRRNIESRIQPRQAQSMVGEGPLGGGALTLAGRFRVERWEVGPTCVIYPNTPNVPSSKLSPASPACCLQSGQAHLDLQEAYRSHWNKAARGDWAMTEETFYDEVLRILVNPSSHATKSFHSQRQAQSTCG